MNIYRDYDREALDEQYNVRLRITDFQAYFDRFAREGEAARQAHPHLTDVPYGEDALQTLDFFPGRSNGRPLLVFIHGGYWRSLDKQQFSQLALPYLAQDINVALINYRLAPQVRMGDIAADCGRALRMLYAKAAALRFDPDAIWLMGHSAGAHLAALIASLGAAPVRGVCGISGIYDLEPVRLSYLNEVLHLSPSDAQQASPQLLAMPNGVQALLCAGDDESAEFLRQRDFYAATLRQSGHAVEVLPLPGQHHLSVVDVAADAGSGLTQSMLRLILA
ncbi:alpha/beta hydrolase [Herbaspirillum huttiense F1]|uniref:alpha/beta hydrolase n=1 Tax=Herbaspirillum huttiense TaxID=863372 RepID=UPI0028861553|nr:alpha/beta hydrolase [Herbaspirillum huttiense]MDT0357341.1 alpha/beta hydrolase [Herbaspirillum huttiense F1]